MWQTVIHTWAYAVLAVTLIVAAVTDVRTGKIYNAVTYPAVVVGLVGHTLVAVFAGDGYEGVLGPAGALGGLAVGFLPLFVAWRAGGIGGGDAKLMAAVGALTGVNFAVTALAYGLVVAALMAVGVMIQRRVVRQTFGRIGRFLYIGMLRGKPADPATAESPKIAFGLALCIGSAGAMVELFVRGRVMFEA
ncbi:hypothetical protein LCGC14_0302310 [marine sediment metagenome]|uniref:Prepilin type IV endopeptidase peptidase domain-containing protein n=1 Tax=marine sediment metagenome TaxID=412755 RepID=A0A0F9U715_9ZZZZ|nr:prepilin peptidase [Phycisphaerae bacterium]HDZ45151.1 prepilin peptidase [Phycisphaerae bacterium]